jgi:hypothetical protein
MGIYTLYIRSHIVMLKYGNTAVPGKHKAVFELGSVMLPSPSGGVR